MMINLPRLALPVLILVVTQVTLATHLILQLLLPLMEGLAHRSPNQGMLTGELIIFSSI